MLQCIHKFIIHLSFQRHPFLSCRLLYLWLWFMKEGEEVEEGEGADEEEENSELGALVLYV